MRSWLGRVVGGPLDVRDFAIIVLFGLVGVGLARALPDPLPPPAAPRVQVIEGKYDALASYDVKERQLTVSEHAPRELLVCMRGECKLVEDWLGR